MRPRTSARLTLPERLCHQALSEPRLDMSGTVVTPFGYAKRWVRGRSACYAAYVVLHAEHQAAISGSYLDIVGITSERADVGIESEFERQVLGRNPFRLCLGHREQCT